MQGALAGWADLRARALRRMDAGDRWIAGVGDLSPCEPAELEQREARDE